MNSSMTEDTKQVIYDTDETGRRGWIEVFPEDEGYERSITVYRTPQGWVTIPE